MIEADGSNCSFCGRPRRLALHLVGGPGGRNICDLCVLEARSRAAPMETDTWGAQCSFCGRSSEEAPLMLVTDDAGICSECVQNSRRIIESVLPGESEFLRDLPQIDVKQIVAELKLLALTFEEHFKGFRKNFEKDDMDWSSYNMLAQTISPLKSKAGRMKLDHVSELMWELESAFQSIRFDDIEANRPGVEKLGAAMGRLLEAIGKINNE